MPLAQLNGIRIAYDEGGSGPAVLLSHGYGATGRMWDPQRPALHPGTASSPGTCGATA